MRISSRVFINSPDEKSSLFLVEHPDGIDQDGASGGAPQTRARGWVVHWVLGLAGVCLKNRGDEQGEAANEDDRQGPHLILDAKIS
jgi:hypothetical protein